MLSGNPSYIHNQPIGQNPGFRVSINPQSEHQTLKFYHPSINQSGQQIPHNIPKTK